MILRQLLADLDNHQAYGDVDIEVTGLAFDSRRVGPGSVFFAVPGSVTDGHRYIPQAVDRGAVAIVGERGPTAVSEGVTFVQVPSSRQALACAAAAWYVM